MMLLRLLFALLLFTLADPAQAMRCGNKLVSKGDPKPKVLHHCGEPVAVERSNIVRAGIPWARSQVSAGGVSVSRDELLLNTRSYVEVLVEEWTYNFGPRRLMRVVRFENGLVTRVTELGYGYRE